MLAQAPVVAFFAIKWLPSEPGRTLWVFALQLAAALAAAFPGLVVRMVISELPCIPDAWSACRAYSVATRQSRASRRRDRRPLGRR